MTNTTAEEILRPKLSFSVLQETLLAALMAIKPAVVTKNPMLPIRAYVLFETYYPPFSDQPKLRMRAAHPELHITVELDAGRIEPGAVAVQFAPLLNLVKSYPPERIDICEWSGENKVGVSCNTHSTINTLPVVDFPNPDSTHTVFGVVDGKQLNQAVKKVAVAAAKKDPRPILMGVNFCAAGDNGELMLTAADGYQIAVDEIPMESYADTSGVSSFTINAALLKNIVAKFKERVWIGVGTTFATFATEGMFVRVDLIDGKYPDISKFFSEDFKTRTYVLAPELLDAVKRANIFSRDDEDRVELNFRHETMQVKSSSQETGDYSEWLRTSVLVGEDLNVLVNAKMLMAALTKAGKVELQIQGFGHGQRIILSSEDTHAVIMSVKSAEEVAEDKRKEQERYEAEQARNRHVYAVIKPQYGNYYYPGVFVGDYTPEHPNGLVHYQRKLTEDELYRWMLRPVSENAFLYPIDSHVRIDNGKTGSIVTMTNGGKYIVELHDRGPYDVYAEEYDMRRLSAMV